MGADLMSPTEHSRLLMERFYSLIRYRSQRAASMLISDGSNGELLYRWLSRKSPRLPQGEKWLRILEHLRWRRYHQFPFHMVGGCRRGGKLIGVYGREPPEFPDCSQNWVGRSEPIILLMNWIAGDQEFARYELPFLISLNRSRPCNISRPTRFDWIRIAECGPLESVRLPRTRFELHRLEGPERLVATQQPNPRPDSRRVRLFARTSHQSIRSADQQSRRHLLTGPQDRPAPTGENQIDRHPHAGMVSVA